MCSILGIFEIAAGVDLQALREQALSQSARQRHRGPDWSGVHVDDRAVLVHERLAIVDVSSGAQPLRSADGGLALAVNGEIYNHRELRLEIADRYAFQTASDCEVINALYREHDVNFLGRLNGIFAFALWDRDAGRYLIARDPIGVCPLYMGHDAAGRLYVASELKALVGVCDDITVFPPGHYLDSRVGTPVRYWSPAWRSYEQTRGVAVPPGKLRAAFEAAVHRQLMSDVPYGVLLSGGLDSSLVAACVARFAKRRVASDDREDAWWPALHLYDCNRANKAMAAWGVEARVPFLDLEFLDVAMSMDAEHKRVRAGRIEKAVLREAFVGALPDSILWRQKEQFSDGVGYGWIDALKGHAENTIRDAELARAATQYPTNPPQTKEALLYRRM